MIVGICIILISVSFFVYQRDPARWSRYLYPAPEPDTPTRAKSPSPGPSDDRRGAQEDGQLGLVIAPEVQAPVIEVTGSPETTPKARATPYNNSPIPTFSLEPTGDDPNDDDDDDNMPPPVFPAPNSAQRASGGMRPPPPAAFTSPRPASTPAPLLMAPPPVPPRRPPGPGNASVLRAPTTGSAPSRGPAPNRAPAPNRGPPLPGGLGVPLSTAVQPPNPRKKVMLKPGCSPLDWAALSRSSANLSGVTSLQRVTPTELKRNNGRKGMPAWSSYQGKVYNMTPYIPFHPGGEGEIRRAAGKDGERLFNEVHPWVNWDNMLESCIVGIMVAETESLQSPLDEVD